MARHGYRGDGAYGQFMVILPEQDVVLAINSAEVDMQAVLDAAWAHLLPAFGEQGDGAEADAALAARLADLELPATTGAAAPTGTVPGTWAGSGLTASREGDGVTLTDPRITLTVPLGATGWTVIEGADAPPVAVSGGWAGDTAHLDLLFLESPHRLFVDLLPDGSIAARWGTTPLDFQPEATTLDQRAPRPLH